MWARKSQKNTYNNGLLMGYRILFFLFHFSKFYRSIVDLGMKFFKGMPGINKILEFLLWCGRLMIRFVNVALLV